MRAEKLKHVLFAYLVLAFALWSVWTVLLAPLASYWSQHKRISTELQHQIDLLASRGEKNQRSTSELISRLKTLVSQQVLGGPATASVSGHQLQTSVKQALQQASATVLEIRPRSMSESRWLNESQLDVSFSIPAVKLESLFKALERQRPLLHIKLMSLREATHSTAGALQLEARLTVSARSVSDSLSRFFSGSTASNENILEVDDSASTLPELAGLFNAAHREKLRNPSAEHYRLSAVSLSANARIAIIADLQSGATRRMQEGELLDGWKITAIKSDSVYLQSGKLTANLRLQKNK